MAIHANYAAKYQKNGFKYQNKESPNLTIFSIFEYQKTKNMKNIILLIAFILSGCVQYLTADIAPRIDYRSISMQITEGLSKKNEQAKAIYLYLCNNIAYDTSYQIRDADECWRQKKGVCQAFADLYIKLCQPLGIKCILVTGFAKTYEHIPGTPFERHAYVMVEGDTPNRYFFVDATWGSGTVNNGTFKRSDPNLTWFHTSPVWMAFSHFPYETKHQMLKKPLSFEEFQKLPGLTPDMEKMGFDGDTLLEGLRNGTITSLPKIYSQQPFPIQVIEIPMARTLKLGETYEFTVNLPQAVKLALTQNQEYPFNEVVQGNKKLIFVPSTPGEVTLSIAAPNRKVYSTVLSYTVPEPTAEEYKVLIDKNPYYSPLLQELDGFSFDIPRLGFNGYKILQTIQEDSCLILPRVYPYNKYTFKVVDVPLNRNLKKGKSYQFRVSLSPSLTIALFHESSTITKWKNTADNIRSINFTPKTKGTLSIGLLDPEDKKYQILLSYDVQ